MTKLGPGDQTLYVDIEPYRAHLEALVATGATIDLLAPRMGVSRDSILNWLRRTPSASRKVKTHIRRDFADRILAIDVSEAAAVHSDPYIPAEPSKRRLQALVAHGYSRHTIARALRIVDNNVGHILRQDVIRRSRAEAITALYPTMAYVAPSYRSNKQAHHGRKAASRARALGWHGPLDWDDIETGVLAEDVTSDVDDEYLDMVAVTSTLNGDWQPLTPAERREVIIRARQRGMTDGVISGLIHCNGPSMRRYAAEIDAIEAAAELVNETEDAAPTNVVDLAEWRERDDDAAAA